MVSIQLTSYLLLLLEVSLVQSFDFSPFQSPEVCPRADPAGCGGHREEGLSGQKHQLQKHLSRGRTAHQQRQPHSGKKDLHDYILMFNLI